jgi:hypothetical protein
MAPLNVNNTAERFRVQPMAGGWSWRLIIFTSFLLFIVSASYLGIEFGYLNFLDSRRLDLENQVAQIASSIPDADRENLAEFYSRLENLKTTLDKHVGVSKMFPFLEKTTHPQVVYDAFEMQMKTQELTLTGRAASFEVLSKQLLAYQQAGEVVRVLLQSSDLRENIVGFTVKLTLNPSLFKP